MHEALAERTLKEAKGVARKAGQLFAWRLPSLARAMWASLELASWPRWAGPLRGPFLPYLRVSGHARGPWHAKSMLFQGFRMLRTRRSTRRRPANAWELRVEWQPCTWTASR